MLFSRTREVEFLGGPLDGHRQAMHREQRHTVIAIPINPNVFRLLSGRQRTRRKSPASSVAIYQLKNSAGVYRYHFVETKSPRDVEKHSN